ncbi:hypothetical protein VNO78_02659 [Psophocarpus tetragonolobus]|uniref:Uncharacterized protein n=1 Tax=Psophocarpus tetragonolobus TaxID=3891 RepID=A0AAN9XV82_PSOTE
MWWLIVKRISNVACSHPTQKSTLSPPQSKMEPISKACKKNSYNINGDDWYDYAPMVCIGGYGNGDYPRFSLVAPIEGDDDDDVVYDYAPAA